MPFAPPLPNSRDNAIASAAAMPHITMSGGASYGATLHRFQGAEIHEGQEVHNGPVTIANLITN